MKGRSALPRAAFLVGLLAVAGGITASVWGRKLLARIDYFDVRRIEVVGARWLAPDSILHMAAVGRDRSVWEDFAPIERRLALHPLIEGARVRRAGFRSLRIVVREVEPVALVGLPELRAVRGDGTVLPIDPARTAIDLPLLTAPAELDEGSMKLGAGRALRALQMFAGLRALDPGLADVVSDFDIAAGGGLMVNLVLSQPTRCVVLPDEIDEALVKRVRAALADLRSRGVNAALVEARFADQIVVRVGDSPSKSGRQL